MGDGWETRRRRGPGNDWVIVELGTRGVIESIDFDTAHFKGNAPGEISMEACNLVPGHSLETVDWRELVARTNVSPDRLHRFNRQVQACGEASHVRVNVYPDGGVARLRLYGVVTPAGRQEAGLRWLNALTAEAAAAQLRRCCAATEWVTAVIRARPFASTQELFDTTEELWWKLTEADWQEAFASHPAIGARADSGRQDAHAVGWSQQEQAGTHGAAETVTARLLACNQTYRERFGYTYIVCASGRNAVELLNILEGRLVNEPEDEVKVAAGEQAQITRLRLEKLLG
jgi:allantoicase